MAVTPYRNIGDLGRPLGANHLIPITHNSFYLGSKLVPYILSIIDSYPQTALADFGHMALFFKLQFLSFRYFSVLATCSHRRRSSVNFRGHDIFARKICMKN